MGVVFWLLFLTSMALALLNLVRDPTQRSVTHAWNWFVRASPWADCGVNSPFVKPSHVWRGARWHRRLALLDGANGPLRLHSPAEPFRREHHPSTNQRIAPSPAARMSSGFDPGIRRIYGLLLRSHSLFQTDDPDHCRKLEDFLAQKEVHN